MLRPNPFVLPSSPPPPSPCKPRLPKFTWQCAPRGHPVDGGDIQAACRDVGREQHHAVAALGLAKLVVHAHALHLLHAAVKRAHRHAGPQPAERLVHKADLAAGRWHRPGRSERAGRSRRNASYTERTWQQGGGTGWGWEARG
eukprot:207277-Chlamydomonas_euryale.AAC.1